MYPVDVKPLGASHSRELSIGYILHTRVIINTYSYAQIVAYLPLLLLNIMDPGFSSFVIKRFLPFPMASFLY